MMRIWKRGLILAVFFYIGSVGAGTGGEASSAQAQNRHQANPLDWSCLSKSKYLGLCFKLTNTSNATPRPEDTRGRRGPVIECYPVGCCYEMISRTIWSCET
jgi:hypothetical protein